MLTLFAAILLAFSGFAQNQITMTMSDPINVTATSFEFDILVANTGTSTLKLSAGQPQIQQVGTGIPVTTSPTYEVVSEGPVFAALNNPTPAYNNSSFRISQSPIGTAASAITIPNAATVEYHVKITSTAGAITYPVTLKLRTTTPNITLSAYVDANGTTTTFSLAAGNLVLGADLVVSAPAALDLGEFSGEVLRTSNNIHWLTLQEKDVANHIIERSADGVNWSQVGRVPGKLNSNTKTQYNLEDKAPLPSAYYRLRSVEVTGREDVSHSILLERKSDVVGIQSIFPSPTDGFTTVRFNADQESAVRLRVTDLSGRLVLENEINALKGVNDFRLDLSQLVAGSYMVSLLFDNVATAPFSVVKI